MKKEILVDVTRKRNRVALCENKEVVELHIEKTNNKSVVGNIYVGRVENVIEGIKAAFIDIGLDKNAFLYSGDMCEGEKFSDLKKGEEILVQVIKEPSGEKGVRVTTNISIQSRYCVLFPFSKGISVSRKIRSSEERNRLERLFKENISENIGVIVRTSSDGEDENIICEDIICAKQRLNNVIEKGRFSKAPLLIESEEPLAYRVIRDMMQTDIERIIVNDKQVYKSLVDFMKNHSSYNAEIVFDDESKLWYEYDVSDAEKHILDRKVMLKSGAYIVIDRTEALTCIDVNSGGFDDKKTDKNMIVAVNVEAAREIAKQVRLRNISGIIIIDFIDMKSDYDKNEVIRELRESLKKDKIESDVLGITKLGLVEMTRKKTSPPISEIIGEDCKKCNGSGNMFSDEYTAFKISDELRKRFCNENINEYMISVPHNIFTILKNDSDILPENSGKTVYLKECTAEYSINPIIQQNVDLSDTIKIEL